MLNKFSGREDWCSCIAFMVKKQEELSGLSREADMSNGLTDIWSSYKKTETI
jgi:hypothetical protein